jgi:hypothetical protein
MAAFVIIKARTAKLRDPPIMLYCIIGGAEVHCGDGYYQQHFPHFP